MLTAFSLYQMSTLRVQGLQPAIPGAGGPGSLRCKLFADPDLIKPKQLRELTLKICERNCRNDGVTLSLVTPSSLSSSLSC